MLKNMNHLDTEIILKNGDSSKTSKVVESRSLSQQYGSGQMIIRFKFSKF